MHPRHLTDREAQVLKFIAFGRSYKEVASDLGISVNTVRNHAASIRVKLGAHSMVQALQTLHAPLNIPSEHN